MDYIHEAEVILIPEEDRLVNDLGIKGLGELGNVGTNAAVANAVYHATGVRFASCRSNWKNCSTVGGCDPTLLVLEDADLCIRFARLAGMEVLF